MKIYCFTGASGVAKSTLIKYIQENFTIPAIELSAREFLPKNDSYDKTLTDNSQILIAQHRFLSVVEYIIKGESVVLSRSPIDNLAYQYILNKGQILDSIIKREIEITKDIIHYLYIPVEFDMKEEDIVRGNNKQIQCSTNSFIRDSLFFNFVLNYDIIKGTIEERCKQLDKILSEFKKDESIMEVRV